MTPYVNGLKEKILSALGCAKEEKPFSGLKIVVDAGNGAGGFFAERLLEPLGADITGSRFLEPDGRFPNHQPNPENAEAMRSICDAVTETGADFGVIFDTDVDRAGAVLPSDGGVIALDRNRLIALMTADSRSSVRTDNSCYGFDYINRTHGFHQLPRLPSPQVQARLSQRYKRSETPACLGRSGKKCDIRECDIR